MENSDRNTPVVYNTLCEGVNGIKCQKCQREISEDKSYSHLGEALCDSCYMDAMSPPKTCDPWAVYSATHTRQSAGLKGVEGLTPLQKEINEFIKGREKATRKEDMVSFNITQRDLKRVVATLRYCELVRGQKERDKVYLFPF
jgi:late competence protein required for DNA uptake (superfamily II DNA/RNA helicase)